MSIPGGEHNPIPDDNEASHPDYLSWMLIGGTVLGIAGCILGLGTLAHANMVHNANELARGIVITGGSAGATTWLARVLRNH